ncbi:TPA: tetratricopeptide repeat protein [Candidatus Poribacteria bacterium]|nr:tetratricopeptide repeat protein [Candidatus Poribacteria bacterium]HEX29786.1 tetratricopeptide repeat protein [Candidatus Poribacteria bacterium]
MKTVHMICYSEFAMTCRMRWPKIMLIFIIVLVASLILPSCAHVGRGARPNEDAVREFAKTHGIDEDVARFYLNHPEYIKRHYSSPPAYHPRNYRMRTFLMRKYFDMAMEYKEAGDLDMAIETLKRVQRLKPDSATVDYNLGLFYFESGMTDDAVKWYSEALRNANSADMIVDVSINLALCYLKMGKLKEAENRLEQAAELAPDDPTLLYNLGTVYLEMGKYERAIGKFMRCLDSEALSTDAKMGLGLCYAKMDRREEALKWFREVAKLRPGDPQVWYNIGVLTFELGDLNSSKLAFQKAKKLGYGGGIEEFLKAIKGMRKRDAKLAYNKGVSLQKEGKYEEAIKEFKKALQLDPKMEKAYLNAAFCLSRLGKSDKAIDMLNNALSLNSDFFEAQYNLGVIYLKLGRPRKAAEHLRKAVKLKPNFTEGRYNLGIALYRSGMFNEASKQFKAAVKLAPWWADAHYNLAMSYLKLGMKGRAISELKTALRIDPGHRKSEEMLRSIGEHVGNR